MEPKLQLPACCVSCNKYHHAHVNRADLDRYCGGALVQDVWPDVSVDFREVIIGWRSGIFMCPSCFAALDDSFDNDDLVEL